MLFVRCRHSSLALSRSCSALCNRRFSSVNSFWSILRSCHTNIILGHLYLLSKEDLLKLFSVSVLLLHSQVWYFPTTSFHSLLSPFSSSFLRIPSLPQPHHYTVYSALFLLHSYEPLHCPNHIISQFTQPFFFFILTNPFTAPTTSFHSLLSPFSSSFLRTPSLPQPHHFTVYSALFLLHSYGPLHCPNHIISQFTQPFFFFILMDPFTAPTTSFHSLLSPFSSSFLWTPSLPQPVKFPCCKAHIHMPANSISDGPVTILLSRPCGFFNRNPFTCSCEGGGGGLNDFKFGAFIGRFLSDGMASIAVTGLKFY